jgi:hypothetical protein
MPFSEISDLSLNYPDEWRLGYFVTPFSSTELLQERAMKAAEKPA